MNLNLRALAIDAIRLDGGTQVREGLDEAWVQELMGLYDEGHEIDPVLVVVDASGAEERLWLADGFHRVEAKRRLNSNTIMATVRTGSAATLDMAKILASAANKNGRPLLPGDKRRAVLMARSTPEGATMGVRELARHCGVTVSYVSEILGGCSVPNTTSTPKLKNQNPPGGHRIRRVAELWIRVDEALRADPSRPASEIAAELDCEAAVVRRRRDVLGLPKSDPARRRQAPTRDRAAEILREHSEWTNAKIADETGATPQTVSKLRERFGMAPSPRGGCRPRAPSAPPRKGGDVRDGAEVIRARPPEPPASGPRLPSYSTFQVRDLAATVIRSFTDADFALLTSQFNARRTAAG